MKKILIIGIVLILLVTTAQAMQNPYIIVGHVYDNEGLLASGIEVTLLNIRTEESQAFVTNEKGEYLFECLNFKQGFKNKDKLNISCVYGSQEVIIDTQYAGIQCPINKPSEIPVEPIIAGTILVSVLGGAYYYIKRKKKTFIKREKEKDKGVIKKMSEEVVKEEKEKKKNPLWLPEGSIRAILAIIALIGVVVCVALGMEVPEYLKTIVGMIIAFFFGGHTPIKK